MSSTLTTPCNIVLWKRTLLPCCKYISLYRVSLETIYLNKKNRSSQVDTNSQLWYGATSKINFVRQDADKFVDVFVHVEFYLRRKLTFPGSNKLGIIKMSFVFRFPSSRSYIKLGLIFIFKIASAYVWVFSKSYKSEIGTDIFKRH